MAVSLGLMVSLGLRDVGYNALNLFTVVLAAVAGIVAARGARRPDGAGLGWGTVLLFLAMVPAVYGYAALLYLPSLVLLLIAMAIFIASD